MPQRAGQELGKHLNNRLIIKKLLLILLCLPMIGFGQDLRSFSKCDIIINQVLENTVSFFKDKNTPKEEFRFYLNNQQSSINWNEKRFSKWKIIDKRETKETNQPLFYIYGDGTVEKRIVIE